MNANALWDLLDRFTELVGPAASQSTMHQDSVMEGQRLGRGCRVSDLPPALDRIDGLLNNKSRILHDSKETVRIAVAGSSLLACRNPVQQAVVLGLVEGVLHGSRGQRYKGRVFEHDVDAKEIELECTTQ
ncbi:MAG: hypothetical protein LC620_06510 [Halobacteriales archaeon]|nr:hypothetical protein [Halobacteriales archaeon]